MTSAALTLSRSRAVLVGQPVVLLFIASSAQAFRPRARR
jgi:hypothetical protein